MTTRDSAPATIPPSLTDLAATDTSILLIGETGTEKAALARHIHERSSRAEGPFVTVTCTGIPRHRLESEIFGEHGRAAAAEGGTLFLDEISELPSAAQEKLFALLNRGNGALDVRVVAATKADLLEEVDAQRFGKELHAHLISCQLQIPPLRERRGEVERLFRALWTDRGETRAILPEVFAELSQCNWPGNVRELENLVERIAVCAGSDVIATADLPPDYRARKAPAPAMNALLLNALPTFPAPVAGELQPLNLNSILRTIEAAYIDAALEQTQGNRQAAASLLGLQRTTLVEKIRRRDIPGASTAA